MPRADCQRAARVPGLLGVGFVLDFVGLAVRSGLAVAVAVGGLAVGVDAELFEELAGDFAGVLALGVAGAAEEVAAAAGADGHGLAALVSVDVGDGAVNRFGASGGGVFAEDFRGEFGGLGAFFLQERDEGFDLLEVVARELFHHLCRAALWEG